MQTRLVRLIVEFVATSNFGRKAITRLDIEVVTVFSQEEENAWACLLVEAQLDRARPIFDRCSCGTVIEAGAAVCDKCLEDSEFLVPSRCKGCGKVDRKERLDFCHTCETDGTEFRLRGGYL